MFRAGLTLVSCCFLAGLTAGTADAKSNTGSGVEAIKVAASEPMSASLEGPRGAEVATDASAVGAAPACARRVKVVYQGYGEADRAGCISTAVEASR